jgi:ATP-dependent DNA helicase RecQ
VHNASDYREKDRIVFQITKQSSTPIIIYTSSRREAEALTARLKTEHVKAAFYHAGLSPNARQETQQNFESERTPVIVSTVAFGMGVDKPNIGNVIHYNMPGSLEAYYQEAGRAGRNGQTANCTLLYQGKDANTQRWLIDKNYPSNQQINAVYRKLASNLDGIRASEIVSSMIIEEPALNAALDLLKHLKLVETDGSGMLFSITNPQKLAAIDTDYLARRRTRDLARLETMVRYGQERTCRRRQILAYFGETLACPCSGCDVCSPQSKRTPQPISTAHEPAELDANQGTLIDCEQLILEMTSELRGKLGRTTIAAVLAGSNKKRLKEKGLNHSKYFGRLKNHSEETILLRMDSLIEAGYMHVRKGLYPKVAVTSRGDQMLSKTQS